MRQTVTAHKASQVEPSRAAPSFGKVVADLWRTLAREFPSTYHPERHYMRGPGPKWHAKHGRQRAVNPAMGLPGTLRHA